MSLRDPGSILAKNLLGVNENIALNRYTLVRYLLWNNRMLWINCGIESPGSLIDHIHERLVDEHGRHHATQFKEKRFFVQSAFQGFQITGKFILIELSLQKTGTAHPWLHLAAAIGTVWPEVFRLAVIPDLRHKLHHKIMIIVNFVMAHAGVLKIAKIPLKPRDSILGESTVTLGRLVGSYNIISVSGKYFCQIQIN